MSELGDITIGVTSFLRYGYLVRSLESIAKHLPECRVIVADDGCEMPAAGAAARGYYWPYEMVCAFADKGTTTVPSVTWIALEFDRGLSVKRNVLVNACQSPYFLLWTDDFKADEECRAGVLRLLEVLDQRPWIAVAGGRVDGRAYECFLDYRLGESIQELGPPRLPNLAGNERVARVDLTANYFLARTEILREFPWPNECKIGGEHVCFFLDLKLAGERQDIPSGYHGPTTVVWVPGVNVNTLRLDPEAQDPRYASFRARALTLGHAAMKRRYGIKRYIGMNGDIS